MYSGEVFFPESIVLSLFYLFELEMLNLAMSYTTCTGTETLLSCILDSCHMFERLEDCTLC
jgi:hypothetical protein